MEQFRAFECFGSVFTSPAFHNAALCAPRHWCADAMMHTIQEHIAFALTHGLCRIATAHQLFIPVLTNWSTSSTGGLYPKLQKASHVDVFSSHSVDEVFGNLNYHFAIACSGMAAFLAVMTLVLLAGGFSGVVALPRRLVMFLVFAGQSLHFFSHIFFGHLRGSTSFWFDQVCVDQEDSLVNFQTLRALPASRIQQLHVWFWKGPPQVTAVPFYEGWKLFWNQLNTWTPFWERNAWVISVISSPSLRLMRLRVGVKSSQNPSWAFIAKSTQLLLLWDDSRFVTLIVPGTMCAWIPSHDKQKEWRPPEGWPDVNHCRALNKRADAAAGSVSASFQIFQEEISAALVQHHSAASWAAAAFKAQKENRQPFWQVLLDHGPACGRDDEWVFVVGNYGVSTILFIRSRLTPSSTTTAAATTTTTTMIPCSSDCGAIMS